MVSCCIFLQFTQFKSINKLIRSTTLSPHTMDTTTTKKETKTDGLKDGQIHRKTNRTDSPLKMDRSIESQIKKKTKKQTYM